LRIRHAGICNTDIEITKGYLGFDGILGHEFVATVAEAPGAPNLEGRRVVGDINVPCHECDLCRRGHTNHCRHVRAIGMRGLDGAFAEYMLLPRANLHPVPDSVTDENAVFVEPAAAAVEITERVHIRPTDAVMVLGDGKLGLASALVLNGLGFDVTVIGRHRSKLDVAAKAGMATVLEDDLPTDAWNERFQVVVEATGSPSGLQSAIRFVEPRGTIVLKSTTASTANVNLAPIAVHEVSVIGSRCGPFDPVLRLLETGRLDFTPMISNRFPLARAVEAWREATSRESLKVMLEITANRRSSADAVASQAAADTHGNKEHA
jgi:threonine dehydrogenase-like Zn-dependent dehydrogenase